MRDRSRFEEAKVGEGWEQVGFGGEGAEVMDGGNAVVVEGVVDVAGEVVADGCGRQRDARRPFGDEGVQICEAVVAGGCEVGDEG